MREVQKEKLKIFYSLHPLYSIYIYEFFYFFFESYICESWLQGIENILDNMIAGEGYFSSNTHPWDTLD